MGKAQAASGRRHSRGMNKHWSEGGKKRFEIYRCPDLMRWGFSTAAINKVHYSRFASRDGGEARLKTRGSHVGVRIKPLKKKQMEARPFNTSNQASTIVTCEMQDWL